MNNLCAQLRTELLRSAPKLLSPATTRCAPRRVLGGSCSTTRLYTCQYPVRYIQSHARAYSSSRKLWSSSKPEEKDASAEEKEPELEEPGRELSEGKEKELRTPWHREGAEKPPAEEHVSSKNMEKGKLLATPSRLLKLVLPIKPKNAPEEDEDLEPLAILVHPNQPLSYLERLIQSELPTIKDAAGNNKIPDVFFRAEDSEAETDSLMPQKKQKADEEGDLEESKIDGESVKTGVQKSKKSKEKEEKEEEEKIWTTFNIPHGRKLGKGLVERYSGMGRERPEEDVDLDGRKFVRWSSSTDIGDFIRDAARGREFAVEIEGSKRVLVAVPSFNDRTFYLRMRLRKTSKRLSTMADVKRECDMQAHKGGQRIAMVGFGLLVGWWYIVYRLTFETELGWDTMEPVTYLVGLSTIIGGYCWFLYHNREVSYRAAYNLTISRQKAKLYDSKGFDLNKWEILTEDANALRKEIKAVAAEYDVEWDERADEFNDAVHEALKEERRDKEEEDDDDKKEKKRSSAKKKDTDKDKEKEKETEKGKESAGKDD